MVKGPTQPTLRLLGAEQCHQIVNYTFAVINEQKVKIDLVFMNRIKRTMIQDKKEFFLKSNNFFLKHELVSINFWYFINRNAEDVIIFQLSDGQNIKFNKNMQFNANIASNMHLFSKCRNRIIIAIITFIRKGCLQNNILFQVFCPIFLMFAKCALMQKSQYLLLF